MIELDCPGCGHHLRISDKFAGKEGKCRYCKEHFFVSLESIETPSDLKSKNKTKKKYSTSDEPPPLPGVASLTPGREAAIGDSIFATPPESTATPELFDAHLNSSSFNKYPDKQDSGGLYWLKYILIAFVILVILGLIALSQLK